MKDVGFMREKISDDESGKLTEESDVTVVGMIG